MVGWEMPTDDMIATSNSSDSENAVIWFSVWARAHLTGDRAMLERARSELELLGIKVRFTRYKRRGDGDGPEKKPPERP